jgi:hypothetical protein
MKGPAWDQPKRAAGTMPPAMGHFLNRIRLRRAVRQILLRIWSATHGLFHWAGGFWEVALVLLAAVLGLPGLLDKPWWARPVVLR